MRETSCLKTKTIAPKSFVFLGLCVLASLSSMAQPTPGGVPATNLKLWFKADTGTNTTTNGTAVTSWTDVASSTAVTDGPSVAKPTYTANGTNYNPSIFYPAGSYHVFSGIGTVPILNSTVFLAGTPVEATSTLGYHDAFVDFNELEFPLNVHDGNFGHYGTGPFYQLPWAYNEPAFVSSQIYDVSGDVIITKGGGAPVTLLGAADPSGSTTNNYYYIGGGRDENGFGYISEAVIFDDAAALGTLDVQKLNSYFSMKYGVINQDPDANNFLLSDGTTSVWGTNSDFSQNILTIVKDAGSGLLQKQAHTTSDSTRLFVGSLAATNSVNGGTITNDLSAVVIANNTAPVAMTTEADVAAPVLSRFQKTWAIRTTNFADNFSIAIQWDSATLFDMSAFRLLFSNDPNIPSGSSTTTITPTFTASTNFITISGLSSADFTPGTLFYFTVGSTTLSTLPVAMTFSAAVTPDSKVALNWQTTSEINNNYFTLERSVNAQNWEAITKVSGAINSSTVKNYSYVDKNPYTGVSYYRIKQTDLDGKYSYSKVKTVKVDKNGTGLITMYPNPVSGTLYIKGAATELATLRIFNMTGVDVTMLVKVVETTSAGRVLDVSRLSAGNYNIKTATAVTKLIKQ